MGRLAGKAHASNPKASFDPAESETASKQISMRNDMPENEHDCIVPLAHDNIDKGRRRTNHCREVRVEL